MNYFQNTFILQGGPVMYPLLILSVVGFFLFFERALFLHKAQIGVEDFLVGIKNLIGKKRLVEALTLCEDTPGPISRIVKSALLQYNGSAEHIRLAIQSAAVVEIPVLERRIGAIAAIARIAPLLGLLGTIVGAVQALYALEQANGNSGEFTSLLAQALISTGVGIAIAVMAMVAHHFLYGRVRALVHEFEWVGHSVYELLTVEASQTSGVKDPGGDDSAESGGT